MKSNKPTLELLREEEAAIKARAAALEAELAPKRKSWENQTAEAKEKAGRLRAEVDALKARAAAAGNDIGLLRQVREKARAVLEADVEALKAENELVYLLQAPALCWIEALKEFVKSAERRIAGIGYGPDGAEVFAGGWPLVRAQLEDAKDKLHRANDDGLGGAIWLEGLDEAALRELRFDPQILEAWLPELSQAISEIAGTGGKVDVKARYNGGIRAALTITYQIDQRRTVSGMTIEELK
ncbi:MAG: hypothetical protein ABFD52_04845 [Acidobacteriota bacterium]